MLIKKRDKENIGKLVIPKFDIIISEYQIEYERDSLALIEHYPSTIKFHLDEEDSKTVSYLSSTMLECSFFNVRVDQVSNKAFSRTDFLDCFISEKVAKKLGGYNFTIQIGFFNKNLYANQKEKVWV